MESARKQLQEQLDRESKAREALLINALESVEPQLLAVQWVPNSVAQKNDERIQCCNDESNWQLAESA